jgi:hypothetical protein
MRAEVVEALQESETVSSICDVIYNWAAVDGGMQQFQPSS